jgi:hypothetical protein
VSDKRQLVEYQPPARLEAYHEFLVPENWTVRGKGVHISGGQLGELAPVALVLDGEHLILCGSNGPVWARPLSAISGVRVEDLSGISFPLQTPAGVVQMVPPSAKGVAVEYQLTLTAKGRLVVFVVNPRSAHEWVEAITKAIYEQFEGFSGLDELERRG